MAYNRNTSNKNSGTPRNMRQRDARRMNEYNHPSNERSGFDWNEAYRIQERFDEYKERHGTPRFLQQPLPLRGGNDRSRGRPRPKKNQQKNASAEEAQAPSVPARSVPGKDRPELFRTMDEGGLNHGDFDVTKFRGLEQYI